MVIVGRGLTVGRPLGLLFTRKGLDATVTLTHSRTVDLAAEVRRADIVVAAVGVPTSQPASLVNPVVFFGSTAIASLYSRYLPFLPFATANCLHN